MPRTVVESSGNGDFSLRWAGENVGGCKPVPAAVMSAGLASGFRRDDKCRQNPYRFGEFAVPCQPPTSAIVQWRVAPSRYARDP